MKKEGFVMLVFQMRYQMRYG
ncbi:23S rRNA methyltransferase attenuation leader peptide [Shigella flexneri]|nr:23S rRNA methyltransferase attenuation leader peptide [Shigella flexneri]